MRSSWIGLWGLLIFLAACSVNHLDTNSPFQHSATLNALAGTYQNLAQSSRAQSPPRYLSAFIWKGSDLQHPAVDQVEVVLLNAQTLQVSALGASGLMKADRFIQGQHFKIESGRLEITPPSAVVGAKSGEPMLGVYSEKISLGLDTQGQGKLRHEGAALGLVMGLMPMALESKEDLRFVKIR